MVNICASIYVTIIHADMDAFYASVGQRDNLYLKGGSLWAGVVVDEG
jgi:nucleotidyltransferase/DNA polymerase involved in DNA repair